MPVINTPAARQADARLEDDKQDWYTAHKIAALKTKDERNAALEALLLETDKDYYTLIRTRAASIYATRAAKAKVILDQASVDYQKTFGTGGKASAAPAPAATKAKPARQVGVTGTIHRAPQKAGASAIAELLNSLSEGVEAAQEMDTLLPDGPEKSAGLRKLLEAKDCFVRAAI